MGRRSKSNPDGLVLFDSHCHLTDSQLAGEVGAILRRASSAGVKKLLTVSQNVPDSKQTVALARLHENLYCAVGVHPHEADGFRSVDIAALKDLCIEPKVKAIGEIGLDFFRGISSRANQETAFQAQVALARMLDLPMVIHVRDAPGRLRSILEEQDYYNGVLHCFSSDRKLAEWAIEKGLHVSFSGNVTYGDSRTNEILRMVPRERLMIETDAPYLAPVPHRGERNEPAYVAFVAEQVAKLLESDTKTVAELTHDNSVRLFRI